MWIAGQISFGRANQIQQSKIQSLCPRRNGPVILDSHMLAHGKCTTALFLFGLPDDWLVASEVRSMQYLYA